MQLIALFAAVAAIVPTAFASLTINTPPNVVVCEPTMLSWTGGQAPYYLTVIPDGQVSATPLKQFPAQNGTSLTWTVDLQAGLNVDIALKDSTGQTAYTSRITIQSGSDTSCLTSAQSSASGSSSAGASTASSGSTAAGTTAGSTPAASPTGATGATSAGSPGSSTTSASGSRTTTTSGAGRLGVSATLGVAGIMGLVGAALF